MNLYSLPIGRKEVVRRESNCFYRAIALGLNEKSERDFANVRAMCNNVMIQHRSNHVSTVFVCLYSHTTMEKHLETSLPSGTWGEPVDIFAGALALQLSICVYSMLDRCDPRLLLPPIRYLINGPTKCDCLMTLVCTIFIEPPAILIFYSL